MKENKIVWKLTYRDFIYRIKNHFLTIIAIMLTTTLLTSVLAMGVGITQSVSNMMLKSVGRSTEVCFQYLSQDEVTKLTEHSLVKESGISRLVGISMIGDGKNRMPFEIRTADENYVKFTYSELIAGTLPYEENEVAISSEMFAHMDLPLQVGEKISLELEVGTYREMVEFIVSGYWDGKESSQSNGIIFISDSLANRLLSYAFAEKERNIGEYQGLFQVEANLNCEKNEIEEAVNQIINDLGLDYNKVSPIINENYLTTDKTGEKGIMLTIVALLFIVLLSGYLLIYNTIYISTVTNIHYFGTLKSIGATRKMIYQIVVLQALTLSIIGIPIGLIFGVGLGKILLPALTSGLVLKNVSVSIHPGIFLVSIVLSIIAVLFGCRVPAKIAGKISAIEAMRFVKKSNKNQRILAICSISLGLILFNIAYIYTNSFDLNKYLQTYIFGDYVVANNNYFDYTQKYEGDGEVYKSVLDSISEFERVKSVESIYYEEAASLVDSEVIYGQIYGIDDYWEDIISDHMLEGSFDRNLYETGNYAIIGYDYNQEGNAIYQIGDTLSFFYNKNPEKTLSYEVMGKIDISEINALSTQFITVPGYAIYLPANCLLSELENSNILLATVFSERENDSTLTKQIDDLLEGYPYINYRSRQSYIEELEDENKEIEVIGFVLCFIIYYVGILNFINTFIKDIVARDREFALLKAIGMTNKQIKKKLIWEGLEYAFFSIGILLTVGNGLSYFIVKNLTNGSPAYTYHFSWLPTLISVPVTLLIAIAVPLLTYLKINKSSIVERLRME